MKERPILFTGEMVRAILDGRKTQTRRLVKLPLKDPMFGCEIAGCEINGLLKDGYKLAPLGTIGDRLWVRETWGLMAHHDPTDWFRGSIRGMNEDLVAPRYSIEHRANWKLQSDYACWRPSIHMPQWASRIGLEITAVRVERVQDISEEDAESEGVDLRKLCGCKDGCATCDDRSPKEVFRDLWQSIYANWDSNPWVWVYEFRRINP